MLYKHEYRSIEDLVDLYRNGMLKANPEYQRGEVWTAPQKKKLIDSVLRRYPLPVIYLHHIKKSVAGMQREDLEIIDGQQRITALYEFAEGAYALFDPVQDDAQARFPNFLKEEPCPWGRKDYHTLPDEIQELFLKTELPVAMITSDDSNEVRDLFVRLQAGLPLNAQEKRDVHPGNFTDFILQVGGKPQLARYPGHSFFQRVMRMNPRQDRGKTRQLTAQITMLHLAFREGGPNNFPDINAQAIDDFYYRNLDFEESGKGTERLRDILTKLDDLLGDGKRPALLNHHAIHLVMLTESLWDDYTRSWEATLPGAVDRFSQSLAAASKIKDATDPFWGSYGLLTRANSDRGDTIRRRHGFYTQKMFELLGPLQQKDPQRLFGCLERQIIYFRDGKKCAVCAGEVSWNEAEIHHVVEHQHGGRTDLDNGVLVHRHCHPRGATAQTFADGR